VKHGIGRIIIGRNEGWKQDINLGKKTNQAFCFVPTYLLLEKIKYKAAIAGIDVILDTPIETEGNISYACLSSTLAQMEAAKLEFYRRKVAPYEEGKIQENGDVH
jgi:IS605 OrfB family transposase